MRVLLIALVVLVVAGCSVRVHDPDMDQKCQQAKDLMANGLPVDEFRPNPAPPVPSNLVQVRGKQEGATIKIAAVAAADPQEVKDQLAKTVTDRGWTTGGNSTSSSNGKLYRFWTTYQGPGIQGDVTLLPCVDDDLVVFNQQAK